MACGGGRRAGLVPGGHARHAASGQGRAGWGSTCARGEEWPVWLGGQEMAEVLGPDKVQVRIALT